MRLTLLLKGISYDLMTFKLIHLSIQFNYFYVDLFFRAGSGLVDTQAFECGNSRTKQCRSLKLIP